MFLLNASAEHPFMDRITQHPFLKILEKSMTGENSTELAPFYRSFCVIDVFFLGFLPMMWFIYYCHFNDWRNFETGHETHVSHIWFVIMQASQPLVGLLYSVHFLSRPMAEITIFTTEHKELVQGNAPAIVLFFFFAEGLNIFILSAFYGITRDMSNESAPNIYRTVGIANTFVTYGPDHGLGCSFHLAWTLLGHASQRRACRHY